jgi:putative peptide modification target (TIGR04139 family)
MKKLNGIIKDFSSFENKELKNLQSIVGGLVASQISIESNCAAPGTAESDKYTDGGTYICRVTVGPAQ